MLLEHEDDVVIQDSKKIFKKIKNEIQKPGRIVAIHS